MIKFGVKVIAAVGAAATALVMGAGAAGAASHPGAPVYSPEQAGYSATGANFRYVETTFKLPDASQFASEVGGFGLSVHLWSASKVFVLGVSNSTTPGNYNAAVAVYNARTHGLICSTAAAGAKACPGVPADWTSGAVSFAPGSTVTSSIYYNKKTGQLSFRVTNGSQHLGYAYTDKGEFFNQARVGAEFSPISPWRKGFTYNPPSDPVQLAMFKNTMLTSYSGHHASFNSWWTNHKIIMTEHGLSEKSADATVHNLRNDGHNFGVWLLP